MNVRDKINGTIIVGVLLVAGVLVFDLPRRYTKQTTNTMPAAKRTTKHEDGRAYAVIQVCIRPNEMKATIHYIIEPIDKVESTHGIPCSDPFTRKGLVRQNDLVSVSWAVVPANFLRGVKWRITVNNQVVASSADSGDIRASATEFYIVTGRE